MSFCFNHGGHGDELNAETAESAERAAFLVVEVVC